MEKKLNTAQDIKDYAETVGFTLSMNEAQMIVDYIVTYDEWDLTVRDDVLYRCDRNDTLGIFEEEAIPFSVILDMLTKSNAEMLSLVLMEVNATREKEWYNRLKSRIDDEEIIAGLWKRMYSQISA